MEGGNTSSNRAISLFFNECNIINVHSYDMGGGQQYPHLCHCITSRRVYQRRRSPVESDAEEPWYIAGPDHDTLYKYMLYVNSGKS